MRSLPVLAMALVLTSVATAGEPPASGSDASAAPPTDVPAAPAGRATSEQLIEQAVARLGGYRSMTAKVRQRTFVFGQQVLTAGRYLEGPPDAHLVRLELRMQVGSLEGTAQQVCDGKQLWTFHRLGEEERLEKIDVTQVLAAREEAPDVGSAARVGWQMLGIQGLRGLVQELAASFQFEAPQASRLGELRLWGLRGRWRPERLKAMLPDQTEQIEKGREADLSLLPPQVPDEVVLYLGREDLFPYRIEYRRRQTSLATRLRLKNGSTTLSIIEWFDVATNVPIDPIEFTYNAGDHRVADRTREFLERHGLD